MAKSPGVMATAQFISPIKQASPSRPALRVITSFPDESSTTELVRPPVLVQSAPLFLPHGIFFDAALTPAEPSGLIVRVDPPQTGHRRRLSDKFKSILHLGPHPPKSGHKRSTSITSIFHSSHAPPTPPPDEDENVARRIVPARPHRSPGTASFLVTRHPRHDMPLSAVSTCPSTCRESCACSCSCPDANSTGASSDDDQVKGFLAPPATGAVSHFSDPSTLSSQAPTPTDCPKQRSRPDSGSSVLLRHRRGRSMPELLVNA